jgi:hypothetical protein
MSIPVGEAAAYPVFTADQLNRLRAYGTVRSVRAGEVLFSPADQTYDLLVVLSGVPGSAQWVRAVLCADSLLAGLGAACQSGSARKRRLLKDQHDRDNQQHGAECD